MKGVSFLGLIFVLIQGAIAQTNWYVGPDGVDIPENGTTVDEPFQTIDYAVDFLAPGDTLLFLPGEYQNANFGDGDVWKTENTLSINDLHGTAEAYIVFKPLNVTGTVLKGDATSIFRVRNSSYLNIIGFEIYGEVENISLETALENQFIYKDEFGDIHYRVEPGTPDDEIAAMTFEILTNITRPTYTDTKGIYVSNSHHIDVLNNIIHHTPGTGLRLAACDYVNVIGNEVHNCARKSYAGTHAFVFHSSASIDNNNGYKIIIAQNKIHHNYNEIYSWSPSKTIITPIIDEGKGISMQKNRAEDGWTHGKMLIQNNICYFNGLSGIHANEGARMDIFNNTVYKNSLYGYGGNIGISTQSSDSIRIANNVVVAETAWGGFAIAVAGGTNHFIAKNGVRGFLDTDADAVDIETLFCDPQFMDTLAFDFRLKEEACIIDLAEDSLSPATDYLDQLRDELPDMGAFEFIADEPTGSISQFDQSISRIYPNPFVNELFIETSHATIAVYNLAGIEIDCRKTMIDKNTIRVNFAALPAGFYFVWTGSEMHKVVKR